MRIRVVNKLRVGAGVLMVLAATTTFCLSIGGGTMALPAQAARPLNINVQQPVFEVVSIKTVPAQSGGGGGAVGGGARGGPGGDTGPCGSIVQISPGRFVANNFQNDSGELFELERGIQQSNSLDQCLQTLDFVPRGIGHDPFCVAVMRFAKHGM